MPQLREDLTSQDQFLELNQALDSGALFQVRQMLNGLPTASIAHLLESSPPKSRSILWQLIEKDNEGDVLHFLNEDIQNDILRQLNAEQVVELTEGLETDDLADVLQQLPQQVIKEVLQAMGSQDRLRVESILSYPEDTAGGLMNTDTITVRARHTMDVVLRYLRRHTSIPKMTDNILVVNRDDQFIGILALTKILVSDPGITVREVMATDIEALPVDMHAEKVAQLFERYDWVSAPVVNKQGRLVGRITIDDIVDVIRDNAEHSFMSMAGLDEEEDTFAPIVKTARRRSLWLGVNLMTAIIASLVIAQFSETLDQVVALAILMPIVASMGGVAGSQTLTLIIRSMALGHISKSNSRWLLIREFGAALINGALWATVIGTITFFWFGEVLLSYIIAAAIIINLVVAALTGAYLPLFLRRMNIDPALAGTVILTTVTDSIGFWAFLGLATIFYV